MIIYKISNDFDQKVYVKHWDNMTLEAYQKRIEKMKAAWVKRKQK